MEIKPLDIVSMIGIIIVVSSSAISMHIAAKAGKEQRAKQEKDAKNKKAESSSPAASTSELRAELDDLKKRVAALEKK